MRIDLPCCGFKNCRHYFDGNCTKPSKQEKCEYWYLLHEELYKPETEQKKGKWIGKEQFANSPEFYSWQCSVCGCVLEDPTLDKPYPFCPSCGSYNGGEQE